MTGKKLRRNKEIKGEKESKEDMSEGRKEGRKKKAIKGHVPVMSVMPLCSVSVCAVIACAMSADCFALKISLSEYL